MRSFHLLAFAIVSIFAAGCSAPDPDPGTPPIEGSPLQNPSIATLPAFHFHPRNKCRIATESVVYPDVRDVVSGSPSPLAAAGFDCVETGHPGAKPDVVYTDVDDPRVWSGIDLRSGIGALGTPIHPGWMRDSSQVVQQSLDLMGVMSGGEGPAPGDGLSGTQASIAEALTPWSGTVGPFSSEGTSSFNPYLAGLRVGKTPLKVGLDDAGTPAAFRVNVALDPEVMLVPVQAVVFYDSFVPGIGTLPVQRALWDRVPTPDTPIQVPFGGEVVKYRPLANSVMGGEQGPWEARMAGFNLPDDVWAKCGVQFRLVRFLPIQVSKALAAPKNHGTISGPLHDFWDFLKLQPQFKDSGLVTALFAPFCSDTDAGGGQLAPPNGQTLPEHQFACVRWSAPAAVLAHELGHALDQQHAWCPSNPPSPYDRNLMCENTTVGVAVTPGQCRQVRAYLRSSGLLKWFPGQQ